jgi:hypothetical protein
MAVSFWRRFDPLSISNISNQSQLKQSEWNEGWRFDPFYCNLWGI